MRSAIWLPPRHDAGLELGLCQSDWIEGPPEIDRERVVRLPVEPELDSRSWLVPARVIVVAGGLVEAEFHVVMRPDPFGGVDHAPLEGGVDVAGRHEGRRYPRLSR
jgi:hypothetical protein